MKDRKRKTIAGKVKKLAVFTATISLLVNGTVAVISMYWMQNVALESTTSLSDYASAEGESVVLNQSLETMKNQVMASSQLAQVNLEKYASYVRSLVFCAEGVNDFVFDRDDIDNRVMPPDPEDAGTITMKRVLRDKNVKYEDFAKDIITFSKMESVFRAVYEQNFDVMAGIYMVTNSGVMISLDEYSDMFARSLDEDGEAYYDFTKADWYQRAINTKEEGPVFSEAYQDYYGRGLTVTCAEVFRDDEGNVAGVMCIDLLMEELIETVIDLNTGESYYGGIIDSRGNVIASPYIDYSQAELDNIITDVDLSAHEVASSILSGLTGIAQTKNNIYYAYSPIRLTNWTLFIEIDSSEVTKKMTDIRETINGDAQNTNIVMKNAVFDVGKVYVINLIIIVVAAYISASFLSKRITNPLTKMKEAVVNIRTKQIELDTNEEEEIAELAGAFNSLQSDLDDYIEELTSVTAKRERI
ncbi:MAG: cache and HAMP domain-containing protein, partial [Bacteroidaceae bacterium]|nr:cache and HAMP domain-containing protein [Bacteroidaceae bacterium]